MINKVIQMKSKVYVLLCSIVLCTIFSSAAWLLSNEHFNTIPAIEGEDKCEYILHKTELIPREDITSFAVDDEKIYVYYDKTALINVYGTDGFFRYGIQISTIPNGRGDIAALDGKLYIESRRPIIFIFQDNHLVDSIEPYSNYEKYISARTILSSEKKTADDMCNYQLSASNNDIIRQDTQETVIDLPQKSSTAKQLLIIGLFLLALSFLGYEKLFHK